MEFRKVNFDRIAKKIFSIKKVLYNRKWFAFNNLICIFISFAENF
jgi:hypothetical protein